MSGIEGDGRYISGSTIDDLLHRVLDSLLSHGKPISPTRGEAREFTGALLYLANPLARLSRTETKGKLFSCLGELMWYLSGSNEIEPITYYIPGYVENAEDSGIVHGGYGPRLLSMRGHNQIENVTSLIRDNAFTRRAVIQLFDAADIQKGVRYRDVPCTCTLQFLVREEKLHLVAHMRSNDAFIGLPHDVFAFTMIQEIVARELEVELGGYTHLVGSLHLYNRDFKKARAYLAEGWQSTDTAMPVMPPGNPWESFRRVQALEKQLREEGSSDVSESELPPYWADLARVLRIWRARKDRDGVSQRRLIGQMHSKVYDPYLKRRPRKNSVQVD